MDVRTISFPVYFDGDSEVTDSPEECLSTIQITLTGTKYQLQGFVCYFFASYGIAGLQTPDMESEEMLPYHRKHFHNDENRSDINSLGQCYILKDPFYEWLEFSTKHLDHFVSGMEVVPTELLDGSILGDHQNSWKRDFRYVDLKLDEERDLFLNDEDVNPYVSANSLENVDTSGLQPVVVKIEQEEFIL